MIGLDAFLAVAFAGFIFSLKPGPYILTVAALATRGYYGRIASFVIGAYLSTLIVYPGLLLGVSYISTFNLSFVFFLLKTIAAVWFIWLGIKALPFIQEDEIETKEHEKEYTSKTMLENGFAGFILTFCNPYDIIFATGGIPALMGQEIFTVADSFLAAIAILVGDTFALAVYIIPAITLKKFLENLNTSFLNTITGLLMICIGIYIGYTALMADDLIGAGIL